MAHSSPFVWRSAGWALTDGTVPSASTTPPDWSILNGSALVTVIAAVVVVGVVGASAVFRKQWKPTVNPGADWDFSDSWASTVTIGASALAALFGSSDVVTAVGGDKATVAPLIVVGSALALTIVTAAPLLVKVFAKGDRIYTLAIAAAAVLTLSAAGLEGLLLVRLASDLQLGGLESSAPWVGIVLALLLTAYAVRSLWVLFTTDAPATDDTRLVPGTRRRAAVL